MKFLHSMDGVNYLLDFFLQSTFEDAGEAFDDNKYLSNNAITDGEDRLTD